jgi:hypothetical protein
MELTLDLTPQTFNQVVAVVLIDAGFKITSN